MSMKNWMKKSIASMTLALGMLVGTSRAETAVFNGMPIEYTGATANWVGGELVLSFTTPATYNGKGDVTARSGSLTLPREATADILVVGGGGSGVKSGNTTAYGSSGNGGGVERLENVSLAAGKYDFVVGLGGEGGGDTGIQGKASSMLSGNTALYTAPGGTGPAKNSTGGAGTPIPGTTSDITGEPKVYGAGAAAASADGQGASGASNTGEGGQGYLKDYKADKGSGGSGIVVVRIKSMSKPSFVFLDQTIEYFGAEIVSQSGSEVLLKYAEGAGSIDLPAFALVDYLVVGGGGSGGTNDKDNKYAKSGNGGEVKAGELVWLANGSYTVKVGAGGAAQTSDKSNGNAGDASSLVGPSVAVTSAGGGGGLGDTEEAAAGTPVPGTTSAITGTELVYGEGGAKTTSSSHSEGAPNTGNGGMAGGKTSGAGGSGVVYLRIRSLKTPVQCAGQAVVVGETITIPGDVRWGEGWTAASYSPSLATAAVSGEDVVVTGLAPGAAQVVVENATHVFIYNVAVAPFQQAQSVRMNLTEGERAVADMLDDVESITVSKESVVGAEVRDGKLYLTPLAEGTALVTVKMETGVYTCSVCVEGEIVKSVDLVKGASEATSYSHTFAAIAGIDGDGEGVVTVLRDGTTVTFTAVRAGETSVLVRGDVGDGRVSSIRYAVRVKEVAGGIVPFGETVVAYAGATDVKQTDDGLVLVYANTQTAGSFQIPTSYMATVDVLAVGGGGGGGSTTTFGQGGGGGGAGGFVEVDGKKFSAGVFTVQVGAGGRAGASGSSGLPARGSSGGESFITNEVGYAYARAKGGGGGASIENAMASSGLNGGSGGGAVWYNGVCGAPGNGFPGQGAFGGAPVKNGMGGGGGGANGNGGAEAASGAACAGGEGRESAISGETALYSQGGLGGRNDTQKAAGDATGVGFGGNGGNGGPGGDGADGVVIVRIREMTRNIKVPVPTTDDIIRANYIWEDGATYSGLVYDETTMFRSSSDAQLHRWADAIESVTGVVSTNCTLSATETDPEDGGALKQGCGYHNFTIKLRNGYTWEDDGGPDTYGSTGTMSYRWTIVKDASVVTAAIDVHKSVTWTDESNGTVTISTYTAPESADKRGKGVLMLGSLCLSHNFTSNVLMSAVQTVADLTDIDYFFWYNTASKNVNPDGTALEGHVGMGETFAGHFLPDAHGEHVTLNYFVDKLDEIRLAELADPSAKKYDYIIFSFDGTQVSETVDNPNKQAIAEWIKRYYQEGNVIWLTDMGSKTDKGVTTYTPISPTEAMRVIYDPFLFLDSESKNASRANKTYPDDAYWHYSKDAASDYYHYFENQIYYGDAEAVASFLRSKIKVKPYNMVLTDKIVSPEKGLTIKSVTVVACTNGVDRVASTDESDWVDLIRWDRATDATTFPANPSGETWGIPDASLTVDIVSNNIRCVISNVDFGVWTRIKVEVEDNGAFRTSADAVFNEMTGLWEKNPNDGKAYAEMVGSDGIAMHVDGDAETQVPWTFTAYPVKVAVHNGEGSVAGLDMDEMSVVEGGGCSVYYRGDGGYKLAKIVLDGTTVIEGDALDEVAYSYTFNNIEGPREIEVFYEPFYGTVTSASVTNLYDSAVHLIDVTCTGWDETVPVEVRYARWEDRNDPTKYYTAEEFTALYGADCSTAYNPDELTDVGDHQIAYRVFAKQPGYGASWSDEGWVWIEDSSWQVAGESCGANHSVVTPAPLVVRPEYHTTIDVDVDMPALAVDIDGLVGSDTLDDVIGSESMAGWSVDTAYVKGMGEGLYPTWVVDGNGQKLVPGDPELLDPGIEGDGNYGNYYILPSESFQAVRRIPLDIGGVPQGPGLDPEQPGMDTGVDPVEKMYDGEVTGLVVEVTSTFPGTDRSLVEGTDYTIEWALGDLADPATPPAGGITLDEQPPFLHAGTNVVWYYVHTTPGSEADGLYFAASNYQYVVITPRPITVQSATETWVYDGTAHGANVATVVEGDLVKGDELAATGFATATNVGTVDNTFVPGIRSGDPNFTGDAANDYDITVRNGTLTVTPTHFTIGEVPYDDPENPPAYGKDSETGKSRTGVEDAIKVYDGIPTNIVVDVTLPDNPNLYDIYYSYTTDGENRTEWTTELPLFTDVVDATVYFKVVPKGAAEGNYTPAENFARVIITPAEVTVKADDQYIAVGASQPAYTATVGEVVDGNVIDYDTPTCPGYQGAKGEYPILVTGEENQGNYHVTYEPGTLHVVTEAPVVIHYVDEDGKPLLDDKTFVSALGTAIDAADHVENIRHYRVKELPAPASVGAAGLELTIVYGPPDTDIPPTQNDDPDKPSTHGEDYPNDPGQDGNPGYKVVNDPDEPWEVTPDPKAGTEGENPSDDPENKVATTTEWVPPGGTTRVRYEVENDGEFRWDSLIQPGTGTTPASVTVLVDGVTNFVYVASDDDPTTTDDGTEWTPHVIHVEGDTEPGHPHVIELVFTNDDGDGASKVSVDDVTWLPAVPDEKMVELVTKIDVPDTIAPEDPRRVVKVDNDDPSGWVPATYGDDGKKLVGVRSTDGSELTKTIGGEEVKVLESTITINVTGSGELKIGEILFSDGAEDGGTITIRVDGKEYPLDPGDDPTDVKNAVISVCGGGNVEHTVEIVYMRESSDTTENSSCEVRDIQWKTFAESDEGGSDWLKDEGVALWIVDHEERDDGRCYLAFEPQLKVKEEFLDWLRRTRDYNHVYVKYGRTWKECDECEPVRAFAREHRKEKGEYYRDCGDGERDADKGRMWIQVDLPKTTVRPLGYWRIYIDEAEIDFTYGGKVKTVYVDDATGEPIPGVEPFGAFSLPRNTKVAARPRTIPGYICVAEPPVTNGVIETDRELVFTYRYAKATSYTVRYLELGAYPERELAPAKVVPEQQAGSSVTEWALDIDGYVLSDDFDKTITLTANPDANEIVFYYEPKPQPREIEYVVRYVDEDGVWGDLIAPKYLFGYEGDIIIEIAETIPGFRARERKIQFQLQEYPDGQVMEIIFYYWMEK